VFGAILAVTVACSEYHSGEDRIKLITDSAGTVSYLIDFVLLSILFVANNVFSNKRILLLIFLCIFIMNLTLLALTESRAAIILTPFLYIIFAIHEYKWVNKKSLIFVGFVVLLSLSVMPSTVWHRLEDIQTEALTYQHNNNTSIGARFSIWKSGLHSVAWSLLGQSPDNRNNKARQYIMSHERDNPEAYKNVVYHLHDDILETLSLQGVAGVVSLVILYFMLILLPILRNQAIFSILPLSLVIFGLTDTVLIQSQSIIIVFISIIVTYAQMDDKKSYNNEMALNFENEHKIFEVIKKYLGGIERVIYQDNTQQFIDRSGNEYSPRLPESELAVFCKENIDMYDCFYKQNLSSIIIQHVTPKMKPFWK
jgi:O-antigen ligase